MRADAFAERACLVLGDATARWWAIRRLSLSVARMIDAGEAPAVQSALVKEMATRFEQDLLAAVQELVATRARRGGRLAVRTAALRGGPERALLHDPRRDERDPPLGRRQGPGRAVSDWLLVDGARRLLAGHVHARGGPGGRGGRVVGGRSGTPSLHAATRRPGRARAGRRTWGADGRRRTRRPGAARGGGARGLAAGRAACRARWFGGPPPASCTLTTAASAGPLAAFPGAAPSSTSSRSSISQAAVVATASRRHRADGPTSPESRATRWSFEAARRRGGAAGGV